MTVALGTSTPTSITVVATSTSSSPRAEPVHRRLLLGRRQATVQQPEPQAAQLAGRQPLERLLRRRHLELLALVDQRTHHVGLSARRPPRRGRRPTPRPPAAARSAHCVTIGVRPGGISSSTLTSRSPYTVIAAVRGIGVAVITSTSGTCPSTIFVAQRGALLDAEPVLLVDHDDAEAGEVDLLLDQRVGADGDVDRAVGEPGQDLLAFAAGDPVGQQLDAQRPVAEQVAGVGHLQAAEQRPHARRRAARRAPRSAPSAHPGGHPAPRPAASTRRRPSCPTRRRPAAAGASGAATARSRLDLGDHASLGAGERVRQRLVEPADELAVDGVRRGPSSSRSSSRLRSTSTSCTRSSSSNARRRRASSFSRIDSGAWIDRSASPRSTSPSRSRTACGHRVGDAALVAPPQRLLDPPGDLPGGDLRLLALRIDRHDARRCGRR